MLRGCVGEPGGGRCLGQDGGDVGLTLWIRGREWLWVCGEGLIDGYWSGLHLGERGGVDARGRAVEDGTLRATV
jgi:hypothetical protein